MAKKRRVARTVKGCARKYGKGTKAFRKCRARVKKSR